MTAVFESTQTAPLVGERERQEEGPVLLEGLPIVYPKVYAFEGEIARGAAGRIIRARDRRLDRLVAIKELLRPHKGMGARLLREAVITAKLQHPAIVAVHEVGRWPTGEPFYAMRLVIGQTLRKLIGDRATLAERLALLPCVVTVADAIAHAHGEGVVHRDLKPANIMVSVLGETLVIDWGIAKAAGARSVPAVETAGVGALGSCELTREGHVLGTPAYMPPEQAAGDDVDARADVYAIGAVLYHLVSGRPPYEHANVIEQVIAGGPAPLETVEPGVPRELAAIVRQAMARDRGQRHATADDLAADLRRLRSELLVK